MVGFLKRYAWGWITVNSNALPDEKSHSKLWVTGLRESAAEISKRCRFEMIAQVILPDHFHLILDPKTGDVSNILQRIKMSFAVRFRKQ